MAPDGLGSADRFGKGLADLGHVLRADRIDGFRNVAKRLVDPPPRLGPEP